MSASLHDALRRHACAAKAIALKSGQTEWDYPTLVAEVEQLASFLEASGVKVLATLLDNGPAWVIADLAARAAGTVHLPLPGFFTAAQRHHALQAAGADTLLAPLAAAQAWHGRWLRPTVVGDSMLGLVGLDTRPVRLPPGTAKITFTSGTTGTPKGVCLGAAAMDAVAAGLLQATAGLDIRTHLCALPLPVLLENIAGVMAPLFAGATCIVPSLGEVGLSGSSHFDVARFHAAVDRHAPHSMILLPQMLRAWVAWLQAGARRAPAGLKLVAVGGAAVGVPLIGAARALGIPAYEGYGLSEGASVQALNLPGADRPGSVGRALPHAEVRVSAQGEIEISGSPFLGYLGDDVPAAGWWPTGDLGAVDSDGYLHVRGRCKHVLITGFGRNVSPEWVETALQASPAIAHAVVLGEGRAALGAVIWPVHAGIADALIDAAVTAANATLPDYARIERWVRARAPFGIESGLATANGRPRRSAVEARHVDALGWQSQITH